MYLRFSNLNSIHWIIKKRYKPLCTFQDISGQFSGHECNPRVVSKSGNPGPGPVPKTRAQIRIFFITSLLRH